MFHDLPRPKIFSVQLLVRIPHTLGIPELPFRGPLARAELPVAAPARPLRKKQLGAPAAAVVEQLAGLGCQQRGPSCERIILTFTFTLQGFVAKFDSFPPICPFIVTLLWGGLCALSLSLSLSSEG